MNLRRKLLSTFGGLAILSLLIAAMTFYVVSQWKTTEQGVQEHYERSLLLQRVRAATFKAFKEVPDAVTGDDPDSRGEFLEYLRPAREDFKAWSKLAVSDAEKKQVQQVKVAFDVLERDAMRAFDLVEAGRRDEAEVLMEGQLEDRGFEEFGRVTEAAVESDRRYRQNVKAQANQARQTARGVLLVAAFGTLSLVLLLAAYLSSDLFAPLRDAREAIDHVGQGDLDWRLPEEREDELGQLNRSFNNMVQSLQKRENILQIGRANTGDGQDRKEKPRENRGEASNFTLHAIIFQIRDSIYRLRSEMNIPSRLASTISRQENLSENASNYLEELDGLVQKLERATQSGFPIGMRLKKTDVRSLLYDVLMYFHPDFSRRGVNFEIKIAPEAKEITADGVKLQQAFRELILNALNALPAQGGHIGLRAFVRTEKGASHLQIELADDGRGSDEQTLKSALQDTVDEALEQTLQQRQGNEANADKSPAGLRLTRTIIEQHGGHFSIQSEQGTGTHVRILLPLWD